MKAVLSALCTCFFLSATSLAQPAVEFIKNQGQWSGDFEYKAITGKGDIYFAPTCFTYVFGASGNASLMDDYEHGRLTHKPVLNFQAVKMRFEGANTSQIKSEKPQQHYYNYFIGNDPAKWKSNIHPGLALNYAEIYNGIDMHVASASGNPKYEFMVKPGSDPSQIRLRFEGTDGLKIQNGNLILKTSIGDIEEMKPVAYQYINGERKEIPCKYRLRDNMVTYDLPDDYDHTVILIIDPIIVFSTFTGSTADNWGWTATYDPQGNFYAGGLVHNLGYPTTTGAFQVTFGGGVTGTSGLTDSTHGNDYASDIGITKFNPIGTALIYSTYIGGSDNETPHSLIVDAGGNLVIAGKTYSTDYPVTSTAFQGTKNNASDIIITSLDPAGAALVGSTYLGGSVDDGVNYNALEDVSGHLKYNYGDDARSEVLVDKTGNIYLAASTRSADFPVTVSAFQAALAGLQDGVFVKMSPDLSTMLYGTYIGGTNDDAGYVLALDTQQTHVYLGGGTMSTDFPTTGFTWKPTYQGGTSDGYIIKFQNSGTYPVQKICFIGTGNADQVYGVQTDLENGVYAMGQSLGGSFPVTGGVYNNAGSCQFIIKLDSNLTTDVYSTVFGSGDPAHTNISPVAFLVDTCQNVYISGWGGNLAFTTFPSSIGTTNGLPLTPDAFQSTTDGNDFYFIVLSKDALSLLYATYYGRYSTFGGYGEHVDGGTSRFDKNGTIYQAICANCGGPSTPAFPTTSGVWAPTVGSSNCNLAALKINFQLSPPQALPSPDTAGCAPLTVQFHNNTTNAINYLWTFGDGSADDTAAAPIHTFTNAGSYTVRLVAYNPVTCRITDTAFITVVADTNGVNASFTLQVIDSCGPFSASFSNTSTYSSTPGSTGFTLFHWDFGDGTTYDGTTPPVHNFPDTSTYTITLTMIDTTACNSPDTASEVITFSTSLVSVSFSLSDSACLGSPTVFTGIANNAASYFWDFGDGQTSTDQSPVHTYNTAGTFHVIFVGINSGTCNQVDSMEGDVTVYPLPVADFSFVPLVPTVNVPSTFTNLSTGAVSYIWTFGDGNNSIEVNPVHQYIMTGTYHVCLEARNQYGCKDTVCKDVPADVIPLADLPTAFSPNNDGSNEILFVRGGAIQTMDLKIYNRWGELVFESTQQDHGWDGTYKGKPQEMDAYGFVLNVTFIDGTTFMKKGNVTLLR